MIVDYLGYTVERTDRFRVEVFRDGLFVHMSNTWDAAMRWIERTEGRSGIAHLHTNGDRSNVTTMPTTPTKPPPA